MNNNIDIVVEELSRTLKSIDFKSQEKIAKEICSAKNVFVAGAGRSGMMARCFTMRLMHMNISTFLIGEVVTPSFGECDLLIIASGSGETSSLIEMAKKAKKIGGKVALITIYPQSTIGLLVDAIVKIDAPTAKSEIDTGVTSIQPMGSLFEQSLLICMDHIVLILMQLQNKTSEEMFKRHANLE